MNTFDRIKLVTDTKYVNDMDLNASTTVFRNNIKSEIRYKQIKPYNLYISYPLTNSKCIIEVSAKVLGDRYPELININNIRYCFDQINAHGVCKLNIDEVMSDCQLISCDVTKDISSIKMPEKLALKSCLKNFNKFQVQKYTNSGFVVSNTLKTKNRKIRLIFYDKHKELLKAANSEFLNNVDNRNELLDYFDTRFRIEANIRTIQQIKDLFQTNDNNLLNILKSDSNALLQIFEAVLNVPESIESYNEVQHLLSYTNFTELKNDLFLQACNYDPDTIDVVLNNCLSVKTNKGKYRSKFHKLINSRPNQNENIELMRKVREGLHF
jgi:hypothetical protein